MASESMEESTPLFDARGASANVGWRLGLVVALISLAFANLTSQATRFLLNFLYMETESTTESYAADPYVNIAQDLDISPTKFGILTGPLLMMVAVVASVFTGPLADDARVGPRLVILGGLMVQGTAMYAQALVQDLLFFYVARFFFAVGQGAITAPALTIISQMTHEVQRPTANAVFGTGVYLGSGLAASGGILAVTVGWRMTVAIFATLCLLAAATILLCVSSQEEKGHGDNGNESGHQEIQNPDYVSDIKLKAANMWFGVRVWGTSWCSIGLVVAGCLRYFAGFAAASFLPTFLGGTYGRKTELLTAYGIITAAAGVTSTLAGGYATESLLPRVPAAAAWVAGVSSLSAAPMAVGVLFWSPSLEVALAFFLGMVLLGEAWAAPALSIAQALIPGAAEGRAPTSALAGYLALLACVGTMGPLAVGALHEFGWPLDQLLFLAVVCPFAVAGALFIAIALFNPEGYAVLPISDKTSENGA